LLVEMTREYLHEGGRFIRRAHVIKDRFNVIDSQDFDFPHWDTEKATKEELIHNPVFRAFYPHIQRLNLGGEHMGFVEESSERLFDGGDRDIAALRKRQTIAWEQIENGLGAIFPANTGKDKQARFAVFSELLDTTSETDAKNRPAERLEEAAKVIAKLGAVILDGGWTYKDVIELKKEVRRLKEGAPAPLL
jgi:hypothetical protein